MMERDCIPIIDFNSCGLKNASCSDEELQETGRGLLQAFSEVGFAFLTNAGIEQ